MWRKPADDKPYSPASEAPAPASVKPLVPYTQTPPSAPAPSSGIVPPPVPTPAPAATRATALATPALSRISSGLKIRGEISGTTDLYVDGEVDGKIHVENGCVTIGPNGRAQAHIEAREIVIEGLSQGSLKATESVRLGPASRVHGDVLAPRIAIEDGARLRGKVEMVRAGDSRVGAAAEQRSDSEILHPVAVPAESE